MRYKPLSDRSEFDSCTPLEATICLMPTAEDCEQGQDTGKLLTRLDTAAR